MFLGLTFTVDQPITLQEKDLQNPLAFLELIINGTGPLTSVGVEALAFIQTNVSKEVVPYPDAELIFIGVGMHTDRGVGYRRVFRVRQDVYDVVWKPLEDKFAFQVLPMLVHPKSFGKELA